jgi:opacity protein-like surface antigen
MEDATMKKYLIGAAILVALVPGSARGDWLFTPNLGTTFGGDTNGREHFTYGVALGWMGSGIFGWEADLSFTPEFFEGNDNDVDFDGGSNVVTAMGNAIIGLPLGGQRDGGFRPYLTAGLGMLQTEARNNDDAFRVDNSEFGFNVGVGAIGFFSDHVGIRGDVRYLRSFVDPEEDNEFDINVGNFDYWRAAGGVTFRW